MEEIRQADGGIKSYLSVEFRNLLSNGDFLDALACHLPPDAGSRMRAGILRERIREIAGVAGTSTLE